MTTLTTSAIKSQDWRAIVFRIVAGLLAMLFLVAQPALPALLEPWVLAAPDGPGYSAAIHRMHEHTGRPSGSSSWARACWRWLGARRHRPLWPSLRSLPY